MARIRANNASGGGGATLCVKQDIQNSSNEGSVIDLGFAPDFLYVCAIKGVYADSYYYYKDENGNEIEHSVRYGGNNDDIVAAQLWGADKTTFRFHGAGGTSGVYYNVYWGKGFTVIPST